MPESFIPYDVQINEALLSNRRELLNLCVIAGNDAAIEAILYPYPGLVKCVDGDGDSVLHLCAQSGYGAAFLRLLVQDFGASPLQRNPEGLLASDVCTDLAARKVLVEMEEAATLPAIGEEESFAARRRGRLLSEGAEGQVYRTTVAGVAGEIVVKIYKRLDSFEREAAVLEDAQFPFVVRLVALSQKHSNPEYREFLQQQEQQRELLDSSNVGGIVRLPAKDLSFLWMERAELALATVVSDPQRELTVSMVLWVAFDISRALSFFHSREDAIFHRDVKMDNVLLFPDPARRAGDSFPYISKLADFGCARCVHSPLYESSGRLKKPFGAAGTNRPPEQVRGEPYGEAVDVFAFGVMMFEMLTRKRVICDKNKISKEVFNADINLPVVVGGPTGDYYRVDFTVPEVKSSILAPIIRMCVRRRMVEVPNMVEVHQMILNLLAQWEVQTEVSDHDDLNEDRLDDFAEPNDAGGPPAEADSAALGFALDRGFDLEMKTDYFWGEAAEDRMVANLVANYGGHAFRQLSHSVADISYRWYDFRVHLGKPPQTFHLSFTGATHAATFTEADNSVEVQIASKADFCRSFTDFARRLIARYGERSSGFLALPFATRVSCFFPHFTCAEDVAELAQRQHRCASGHYAVTMSSSGWRFLVVRVVDVGANPTMNFRFTFDERSRELVYGAQGQHRFRKFDEFLKFIFEDKVEHPRPIVNEYFNKFKLYY